MKVPEGVEVKYVTVWRRMGKNTAIARQNIMMVEDDRVENVLLTVSDGVMVGRKR